MKVGLHQGSVLSRLLFVIVMEMISRDDWHCSVQDLSAGSGAHVVNEGDAYSNSRGKPARSYEQVCL